MTKPKKFIPKIRQRSSGHKYPDKSYICSTERYVTRFDRINGLKPGGTVIDGKRV